MSARNLFARNTDEVESVLRNGIEIKELPPHAVSFATGKLIGGTARASFMFSQNSSGTERGAKGILSFLPVKIPYLGSVSQTAAFGVRDDCIKLTTNAAVSDRAGVSVTSDLFLTEKRMTLENRAASAGIEFDIPFRGAGVPLCTAAVSTTVAHGSCAATIEAAIQGGASVIPLPPSVKIAGFANLIPDGYVPKIPMPFQKAAAALQGALERVPRRVDACGVGAVWKLPPIPVPALPPYVIGMHLPTALTSGAPLTDVSASITARAHRDTRTGALRPNIRFSIAKGNVLAFSHSYAPDTRMVTVDMAVAHSAYDDTFGRTVFTGGITASGVAGEKVIQGPTAQLKWDAYPLEGLVVHLKALINLQTSESRTTLAIDIAEQLRALVALFSLYVAD